MRVELNVPESVAEPRMWVRHQPVLIMALRTGSVEIGLRRSEMMRLTFGAGEMCLVPRHFETCDTARQRRNLACGSHQLENLGAVVVRLRESGGGGQEPGRCSGIVGYTMWVFRS
jgi:hypothetical protein